MMEKHAKKNANVGHGMDHQMKVSQLKMIKSC